jgi:carbohydrate-selective porin OprB
VEAVRRRFEDWRRDPERGRRIPEELWRAAAELAGTNGIWRTAQALRLNNNELKQRVLDDRGASDDGRARSGFIELPQTDPGKSGGCVIELEDRLGTRLRVELPGWAVPDLAALAREFRRSAP